MSRAAAYPAAVETAAAPDRAVPEPPAQDRAPDPQVPAGPGGDQVWGMSPERAGRVRDVLAVLFCVLTALIGTTVYLEAPSSP